VIRYDVVDQRFIHGRSKDISTLLYEKTSSGNYAVGTGDEGAYVSIE
jgi:hypothetical protein